MKHTPSGIERGQAWVTNAGGWVREHRYLLDGLVGGALIGAAALGGSPPAPAPGAIPAPLSRRPPREAVAAQHAPMERPVLLGNLRGIPTY